MIFWSLLKVPAKYLQAAGRHFRSRVGGGGGGDSLQCLAVPGAREEPCRNEAPMGSLFSRLGRKRERKTERKKESENPHGRKYRKRRAGLLGSLSRWLSPQQGCPASLLRHGCSAPRRRHSGDNRPSRDECWGFLPALTAAATASPFSSLLSSGLRLVGTAAALLLGFPTREDLCDGIVPSSSNPRASALLPSMARERVTAVHGRAEAEKDEDEKTDLGSDQRRGSGGGGGDDRLKAPRGKVAKFFSGCRWQNRRRRLCSTEDAFSSGGGSTSSRSSGQR